LAIKETRYVTFAEAVFLHIRLMKLLGERRYGVFDRTLIESALARSLQAAAFENADLIRQAATLCFGLIKNHPWVGGNKRTATAITDEFLFRNGYEVTATPAETVEMVLAVEGDRWGVDEVESWLRERAKLSPVQSSE
jgi:death-on-curing protein